MSEENVVYKGLEGTHFKPANSANKWMKNVMKFKKCLGKRTSIIAELRYDDECKNGHRSFAITGEVWDKGQVDRGGCIHEEIAKEFPELAHLIKWHLVDEGKPWGYVGNTVYFAGNADCWGKRPGEASRFEERVYVGSSPVGHKVPKRLIDFVQQKERELDAARRAAIWPDATDEELMQGKEELTKALNARLPKLMEEFKKDMKEIGLIWWEEESNG